MAERASEVTELKRSLAQALRDKEQLQEVKKHHYYLLNEFQRSTVALTAPQQFHSGFPLLCRENLTI